GRFVVVDFHHRAAGEFDGQMETLGRHEEYGGKKGDQTDEDQHQGMAHERYGAVYAEKFHVGFCLLVYLAPWPGRRDSAGALLPFPSVSGFPICPTEMLCRRRRRPYQRLARARTPTTEENMEVSMPMQCTTAKPRMGPVPKASKVSPTMSV